MSNFYQRFRSEIAAGGALGENESEVTRTGRLIGVLMLALLVWLAASNPWTFVFVLGLLLSVFLHEVGHFSTARLTGMKVTQFFMGFGPRVWSTRRGEVEYGVRALPLGAFVSIVGMNNLDDVDPADEPRAYRSKSYPRRILVITAGSLMHILLAFSIYLGVYTTAGREEPVGRGVVHSLDTKSGPAWAAGIRDNDEIVSVGGRTVTSYESLVAAITAHRPGDEVQVVFFRDGVQTSRTVTLAASGQDPDRAYMGVYADDRGWRTYSVPAGAWRAVAEIGDTMVSSVKGVFVAMNPVNSIRHLANPYESLETRPATVVGVSQVGGVVGESDGLKGVLLLLAAVNVFVGIFNMFPLLPFDGGHAAIATYERIRSRRGRPYRADVAKMVPVATAVVGLLALLMVTGLYLDITSPLG